MTARAYASARLRARIWRVTLALYVMRIVRALDRVAERIMPKDLRRALANIEKVLGEDRVSRAPAEVRFEPARQASLHVKRRELL